MSRTFLLLLCAIYLSQCALPKLQIDLNGCKEATACYVRETCIKGPGTKQANVLADFKDGQLDDNCDVIVQMRFIAGNKYLVKMQVNYTLSAEKIAKSGVNLKQGADQFSCTKDGATANPAFFKQPVDLAKKYEDKLVYCSFILESKDNKKDDDAIVMQFDDNSAKPCLEFSTTTKQTITYAQNNIYFWNMPILEASCNHDLISSSQSSAGDYFAISIDTYSFPPISCDAENSLIITRADGSIAKLDIGQTLTCAVSDWEYTQGSTKVAIRDENFNVVCGAKKFCSLCAPLDLTCTDCTPPKSDDSNKECKTATCSNNQWKTEDGKLLTGEMECKQEIGNANSKNAFWYLKDGTKVTKAACFTHANKENEKPPSNSFASVSMLSLTIVILHGIF